MSSLQAPRGTRDILPQDQPLWQEALRVAKETAQLFGFKPITVPTYEELGLFQRSIGQGTDVIDKELFLVRGVRTSEEETKYALRPEGTAGIVRAFIEHGMHTWPQPVKLYSIVNNFRYDRPQKGRYREHLQFDVEYFGESTPFADAWIIFTTWFFLQKVGLSTMVVQLNSLGTSQERAQFIQALRDYLQPHREELSEDSKQRLEVNPLRILDSKSETDQQLLANAPQIQDYYGEETRFRFQQVQEYLNEWGIGFVINNRLVRGLDYYSHTAFEYTSTNPEVHHEFGGGGRYDDLVTQLGGPAIGAVGAGIGLDRVVEAMEAAREDKGSLPTTDAFVVAASEENKTEASQVIQSLVQAGISTDAALHKTDLTAQLKVAARTGARFAVLVGLQELDPLEVQIKNMQTGEQEKIQRDQLTTFFRDRAEK